MREMLEMSMAYQSVTIVTTAQQQQQQQQIICIHTTRH